MQILEIAPFDNGGHNNQEIYHANPRTFPIPSGWALIPDSMETPNFPFGTVEAEPVDGVMTVTKWTAGEIPPAPEPEPPEPSEMELLQQRIADLEDAMCEADEANEAWKDDIETALCEMDEGKEV